jgi:hypothetical protein
MQVVFLDIDGVLNHCDTQCGLATDVEPLPIPIAPKCMARLNQLIAETATGRAVCPMGELRGLVHGIIFMLVTCQLASG